MRPGRPGELYTSSVNGLIMLLRPMSSVTLSAATGRVTHARVSSSSRLTAELMRPPLEVLEERETLSAAAATVAPLGGFSLSDVFDGVRAIFFTVDCDTECLNGADWFTKPGKGSVLLETVSADALSLVALAAPASSTRSSRSMAAGTASSADGSTALSTELTVWPALPRLPPLDLVLDLRDVLSLLLLPLLPLLETLHADAASWRAVDGSW